MKGNRFFYTLTVLGVFLLWQGLAVAGPKIQSWHTDNGAKVMFVAAPELPMIDVKIVFDAGSARDGDKPGLTSLLSSLLTEGAGDWNADEIAERIDSVGAELSTSALRDMATVSVRSLTEQKLLDVALDTMAAVVSSPVFDPKDVERQREAMLISLKLNEQSPGTVAKKQFYHAVFGDHPYASDSGGTEASLKSITLDDLEAAHKSLYVARNAVISIVGAVDRKQAEAIANRISKGLASGEHAPQLPEVKRLADSSMENIHFPSSQSHLYIGQTGMSRKDPDYYTLYVGNHILGGSGLVSILSNEVREKRGLSYSVYSYFVPMRQPGVFMIGLQTKNARVGEAMDVARNTLQDYMENGPSEEELVAAKKNITGGFPLRISSNSKIVGYISMIGFYDLPLDYLDTFNDRINAVTVADIRDAFKRRIDPEKLAIVVVGNGQEDLAAR